MKDWIKEAEDLIARIEQELFYFDALLDIEYEAMWKKPREERHIPMAFTDPQTQKGKWIKKELERLK